jgi:DNA-binding ferritin-like protein
MKKFILDYITKCESWKTGIKQLHWSAKNLSQHKLCDDIADSIADIQDKVSEVEQSMSGKLPVNSLRPTAYKVTTLKNFINDVISGTNEFYSKLQKEGKEYIGMRSDIEAFLSSAQRFSYLVDFTIKEALKQRIRSRINESNKLTITDGKQKYKLTEGELRSGIQEALNNVLLGAENIDVATEFKHYLERLKGIREHTDSMLKLATQKGDNMTASFIGGLLSQIDKVIEYGRTI